jgi:hypothetical protein
MKWFRGKRFLPKRTIGLVLAGAIAVLLAGGVFAINDFLQLRRIVQR